MPKAVSIPVSQVADEITEIFADMGFSIAEGPDIETDFNNFTALNIPPEHPARQDTTPSISPRARRHAAGAAHPYEPGADPHHAEAEAAAPHYRPWPRLSQRLGPDPHTMFHQVEGLAIDEETHLGHLKWVLEEFCKAFFEVPKSEDALPREPLPSPSRRWKSISATPKVGDEIRIGEGDQWLEILGCGMVHPNVLRNVGLDPARYQGFAFGLGIDRIAMLKYGMPDSAPSSRPICAGSSITASPLTPCRLAGGLGQP